MTGRAAGQLTRVADVVLLDQLPSEYALFAVRPPIHVEHLLARAQVLFRRTMAVETPFHLQSLVLPHERHAIDRAMARDAADALPYMDTVVEINEVGKVVHSGPADWRTGLKTIAQRFQDIAAGPDLRVTVHAGCGGRYAGERRNFYRRVAVPAVDAQTGDVMLVAERHRLRAHDIGLGNIRRTGNSRDQPKDRAKQKHQTKNT